MPRDDDAPVFGPHWPPAATKAARTAQAAGALDAAQLRLADLWWHHLAVRRVVAPNVADFATFGGLPQLERLRAALRPIVPADLAPLRLALKAKRREKWRAEKAKAAAAPRRKGREARLSVPLDDLPSAWRRALREMEALRGTLDAGLVSVEERTPPSAKVIRNLSSTLRIFAGVCKEEGRPVALDLKTFTDWRAARKAAGNRDLTIAGRCKELALFAAWLDLDEELIVEIHDRRRRHERAARGVRKRKEAWMLANDVHIGDVWEKAEELRELAMAAPPASDLRARLTLEAACLALSVVAPLRIGDLHRIGFGAHLCRHADGWSLRIELKKNDLLYDRPQLWPELTPFLDAVVLLDAPGGDFWSAYDARAARETCLFSRDGGATDCGETWPTKVWTRHFGIGAHIVRSLWHQAMFESEDDDQWIALALCGQGNARTAQHYIAKGAKIRAARRGRARIRALRAAA